MSLSSTPPKSPIASVPYDVLVEIFIHCLPEDPFEYFQPNPTAAPMLLCQVCSFWRMVALTCPALWVRIRFIITVESIEDIVEPIDDFRWAVSEHDIEFLQWWKKNQGPIAPYLCLRVKLKYESKELHIFPEDVLVVDRFEFLLEYISSAQYLDIDNFFWQQISRAIQRGSQVTFPNLHTLTRFSDSTQGQPQTIFCASQVAIGHVQDRPPSLLRCLYIDGETLPDNLLIPPHWSTLTHIFLWANTNNVVISLHLWHPFIRSVPYLPWGYFKITEERDRSPTQLARFVFTQLETLSITFKSTHWRTNTPISFVFEELYLPALHTLSLMPGIRSWTDRRALAQISTVLQFNAPNITTISLGHDFLSLSNPIDKYNLTNFRMNTEPFWKHSPHLEHLQFECSFTFSWPGTAIYAQAALDVFIRNAFAADSKWSDLTHPACPIRTITLIDENYHEIKEFAMSRFRELKEKIPNIDFRISAESPSKIAKTISREWGSRL